MRSRTPLILALLALAVGPAGAQAVKGNPDANQDLSPKANYEGMQKLHFKYGPVRVRPGQNTISIGNIPDSAKPSVPGYITAFRPNLKYTDGSVPSVDVLHMHHGVWLVGGRNGGPTWAMGEEKTNLSLPQGFGWRYETSDRWLMNHMIHDLVPDEADVYITWDIDFVPDSAPAAADIKTVHTQWIDVAGTKAYPVFDAKRGWGAGGKYTFPDQAVTASQKKDIGPAQKWTVARDVTLVTSAGHLHPGGLWTDLNVTRDGQTVRLFRSAAHYWEPAGAVSWDVAMGRTPDDWRVQLKAGDVVSVSGTYDTSRASWYESMAIMPTAVYNGADAGGVDPFVTPPPQNGVLTHGPLPENNNHGGQRGGLPNASQLLDGSTSSTVAIEDFQFGHSDLQGLTKVPTVKRGRSVKFRNDDPATEIFHTITACKAPCNKKTGIAYPLADGGKEFDSGELGSGPPSFTAASNKLEWKTPRDLRTGTYTYFCRIHPFMRGAFRVK